MAAKTVLAFVLILTGTVSAGFFLGRINGRWNQQLEERKVAALESIPLQFGDWKSIAEQPINEKVAEILECDSSIHRTYLNRETGAAVNIAIVAGPHGPISAHVPEICYSSQNYDQLTKRRRTPISGSSDDVENSAWMLKFKTKGLEAAPMSVGYAWSAGENWIASENPRIEFAGVPVLYKLQLSSVTTTTDTDNNADPCRVFLGDFVEECWPVDS